MSKKTNHKTHEKKKLVPKWRFPEFRGSGEWEKKKLGDISQIVRGGSPRPIDEYITTDKNGLNWLKIADVNKEAKYVTSTKERVLPSALSKTREVYPDDLIMSNSMSFGRPYILKIKSCIHDGWIAITQINDQFSMDYLYYLILSPKSQEYFVDNAAGSGVKNLNADIIKLLKIATPKNPKEQQKIADCLSSLDELITAETNKLEAYKTHKKGLMQKLFPVNIEPRKARKNTEKNNSVNSESSVAKNLLPEWRFPEFRGKGEWEEKKLNNLCEVKNNLRKPVSSTNRNKGAYPYYGASGIVDYIDNYIFNERLLLVGEDGAKWGAFEKTAFIAEGKYWVNNHAHALKPIKIIDTLLENYLIMLDVGSYITGAAPPKLTLGKLKEIPIPVPTLKEEQQKIADCFSSLDELITAQTQKIEALKTHKKGLMQGLFPSAEEDKE